MFNFKLSKKAVICILLIVIAAVVIGFTYVRRLGPETEEEQSTEYRENIAGSETELESNTLSESSETETETSGGHKHRYAFTIFEPEYLKSEATCTTPSIYYYVCICGSADESLVFENGDVDPNHHAEELHTKYENIDTLQHKTFIVCPDCETVLHEALEEHSNDGSDICTDCGLNFHTHKYEEKVASEQYLASEASCTSRATYYTSCKCGERSEFTFETDFDATKHDEFNASYVCFSDDEHTTKTVCNGCGELLKEKNERHNLEHYTCVDCGFVVPGLYKTGSNYTELLYSWNDLINEQFINEKGVYIYSYDTSRSGDLAISCTVSEIVPGAFIRCKWITGVVIPNSVKSILGNYNNGAFAGCSNLETAILPEGLESIGDYAFNMCYNLKSINIPNGVKSIGVYAFQYCNNLTDIKIPESVETVGVGLFKNCTLLKNVEFDDASKLKALSEEMFDQCWALETIKIPYGITTIPDVCFKQCQSLTSIELPSTLSTISSYAFYDCFRLVDIYYNGDVKSFCNIMTSKEKKGEILHAELGIFTRGAALHINGQLVENLVIPEGVKRINANLFEGCTSIKTVSLPASLKSIGSYAFKDCVNLTKVTMSTGIESIETAAFQGCKSLVSITLPSSIKTIASYTFSNCSALPSIVIPEGVTSIEDRAFEYCEYLNTVTLPVSITKIGYVAFRDCHHIEKVVYNGNLEQWCKISFENRESNPCAFQAKLYFGKKHQTSISIPSTITVVNDYAFTGTQIIEVSVHANVTQIGKEAFAYCLKLKEIKISGSNTKIQEGAISYCSILTKIYLTSKTPLPIEAGAIYGCAALNNISIPAKTKSAYIAADNWGELANILKERYK